MNPINLAKIYSTCMDEIKTRINIILTFNDGKLTTGSDVTNIEFICLQFRKVLELIALASIAPNKEEYSKQSVKFHKDWHAKRILKDLERINPDFYPIPIVQAPHPLNEPIKHFERFNGNFLKREHFEQFYDSLGGKLHANNPFGTKTDWDKTRKQFRKWSEKIINLLNVHLITLIDATQIWVVFMKHPEDGKAHTFIAEDADKYLINTKR
jgi:hypothetical protein